MAWDTERIPDPCVPKDHGPSPTCRGRAGLVMSPQSRWTGEGGCLPGAVCSRLPARAPGLFLGRSHTSQDPRWDPVALSLGPGNRVEGRPRLLRDADGS